MFVLIVVGSVVRTTGSGLACPDWPLCQGRLIPPFEPHVMIEWLHRTLALLVSVMLAATAGFVFLRPRLRAHLGGLVGLALVLLMVQVLLGALTVWKLLQAQVVASHLAVALLLFSTLLTVALITESRTDAPAPDPGSDRPLPPGWSRPRAARDLLRPHRPDLRAGRARRRREQQSRRPRVSRLADVQR